MVPCFVILLTFLSLRVLDRVAVYVYSIVRVTYCGGGDNLTYTYAMHAYFLRFARNSYPKLKVNEIDIDFHPSSYCWFLHTSIYPSKYYCWNEILYNSISCFLTIFFSWSLPCYTIFLVLQQWRYSRQRKQLKGIRREK